MTPRLRPTAAAGMGALAAVAVLAIPAALAGAAIFVALGGLATVVVLAEIAVASLVAVGFAAESLSLPPQPARNAMTMNALQQRSALLVE